MYQNPHQKSSEARQQGADDSSFEATLTLQQLQRRNARLVDHVQHYKAALNARFEELGKLTLRFNQAEQALEEAQTSNIETEKKVVTLSQTLGDVRNQLANSQAYCQSQHEALAASEDEKKALCQALAESQAKGLQQKREIERQNYELAELVNRLVAMSAEGEGDDEATSSVSLTTEPTQIVKPKKAQLSRWAIYRQASLIKKSGWFDAQWYLEQNPDIAADQKKAANPVRHYLLMGGFEGRNPCPGFDSADYLRRYPDVAEAGINPLLHFLKFGLKEQRVPKELK